MKETGLFGTQQGVMIMRTHTRAHRKGGAVAHIMRDASVSVCGRIMVVIPGGDGLRLCKTCARITGVQMEIDTLAFPEIPELSTLPALSPEWAAIERDWLKNADSFTMGNAREVLTQYMTNPSEYDMTHAHTVRMLAKYRAYLKLHTGADFLDPKDTVAPSMQRRQGDGMVNPNSKSVAKSKGATPNQRAALMRQAAFIDSLFSQLFAIQGKEVEEKDKDYAVKSYTPEFFDNLTTRESIDKQFKGNSALIDRLKLEIDKARKESPKTATVKTPAADEGYFMYGDTFLCVKSNRAGTGQYATVWSHETESWEFDRAASYKLMKEAREGKFPRVTPEAAAAFGELYGRCMRCSRTLTDANSIAEAMGKVCAGKMGF